MRAEDVDLKRLGAVLAVAYEREFRDFASLLLLENLGPRTLQSLALVAEVVHGAPSRFSDPARFSFAHGGKDGHPFPVPLKTYDESIGVLRRSLDAAKLGDTEKLDGFKRLDGFVRAVESRCEPRGGLRRGARARARGSRSRSTAAPYSTTGRGRKRRDPGARAVEPLRVTHALFLPTRYTIRCDRPIPIGAIPTH